MSRFIEVEIQSLLQEYNDAAVVADRLMQTLEGDSVHLSDPADNEAFAKFLMNCGFHRTLRDYCARHLPDESFACPWPYFLEALTLLNVSLPEIVTKSLNKAVRELSLQKEIGRSLSGEKIVPEVTEYRNERRYRIYRSYLDNKQTLLEQLTNYRVQGLMEKEKELLKKVQRLYPGDSDVANEVTAHKQRYALEVISKHSNKLRKQSSATTTKNVDPELAESTAQMAKGLAALAAENPYMAYDLAVVAFSLEAYATGLEILDHSPAEAGALWLRMEFLLQEKRYLELLTELSVLETQLNNDPETFFATAYLRAQALWGLGQNNLAIEVMEGLLAARPQYRSASTLLEIWRGQ